MVSRPPKSVPPKDEIRRVATLALIEVSNSQKAPPAARAAAARTLLESLGDIGRLQEIARAAEKPLADMSLTELDEEIQRAIKKE
jgi:hypothetical protein